MLSVCRLEWQLKITETKNCKNKKIIIIIIVIIIIIIVVVIVVVIIIIIIIIIISLWLSRFSLMYRGKYIG